MLKSILTAALAGSLLMAGHAGAQDFPTRPVTMVIPFAAGGPQDTIGRIIGQRMGELLGQTVVIENVGGAGGMTGAKRVADAKPDGYTMILGSVGTHAQNQTLYKRPLYNVLTDFTPVAFLAETPIALITRPDMPVNNFKEFIAYAKANQTKMQYGSAGAGSATHLACVVLNSAMGTTITHVPYKGTGPAMQDLIAGRIDYLCDDPSTSKPQLEGNSVKAITTTGKQRSPSLPQVPTAHEQGLDFDITAWQGLFLAKDTPEPIVRQLSAALSKTLDLPMVRQRFETLGGEVAAPERRSPEYFRKFVADEIARWSGPIKASGVTVE